MGQNISLTAGDGHTLGAYRAEPSGSPKGAVVIIQEIFGVNGHVRSICDQYAAADYVAIAPALFDRVEPGLDLGYGEEDFGKGRETRGKLENDGIIADVQAAIDEAAKSGNLRIVLLRRRHPRQQGCDGEMPGPVPFRRQRRGNFARQRARDQGSPARYPDLRL